MATLRKYIPLAVALFLCLCVWFCAPTVDAAEPVEVISNEPNNWFFFRGSSGSRFYLYESSVHVSTVSFSADAATNTVNVMFRLDGDPLDLRLYQMPAYDSSSAFLVYSTPSASGVDDGGTYVQYAIGTQVTEFAYSVQPDTLVYNSLSGKQCPPVYFGSEVELFDLLSQMNNNLMYLRTISGQVSAFSSNFTNYVDTIASYKTYFGDWFKNLSEWLKLIRDNIVDLKTVTSNGFTAVQTELIGLENEFKAIFSPWYAKWEVFVSDVQSWWRALFIRLDNIYNSITEVSEEMGNAAENAATEASEAAGAIDDVVTQEGQYGDDMGSAMEDLDAQEELQGFPFINDYGGDHYIVNIVMRNPLVEPFLVIGALFIVIRSLFSGKWWKGEQ